MLIQKRIQIYSKGKSHARPDIYPEHAGRGQNLGRRSRCPAASAGRRSGRLPQTETRRILFIRVPRWFHTADTSNPTQSANASDTAYPTTSSNTTRAALL